MQWNLRSSYLTLPPTFFTLQPAVPVAAPRPVVFNRSLAAGLGLGGWDDGDLAVLAGNAAPPGAATFAQAYAGHQFGGFAMLGDGRALVLGEQADPAGRVWDLQLKGSGPTPYSRSGDGRAALGPMLREYLMGEAMHALDIPTTRGLAVVATGEEVYREGALPGAVLTRVASSHLRVGTFEYAAALEDPEALRALAQYTAARHFPETLNADNPAEALLKAVAEAQADLIARWMAVGFVHGVMNTDNMALSGQTIDYGPCAFLDTYRAGQVFSSIDRQGRYAYGRQPLLARWNLTRFAECLLPLIDPDGGAAVARAQPVINGFLPRYREHWETRMAGKLGLAPGPAAGVLADALLEAMEAAGADFTGTFRRLTEGKVDPAFGGWYGTWQAALDAEGASRNEVSDRMARSNPVYVPRNRKVSEALAAAEAGDLGPFETLLALVSDPFTPRPDAGAYEVPDSGSPEEFVTFCGT